MAANNAEKRIVALVDMDCFYVQVEQRRNPDLRGKPCVVVQYKKWKGGGIIAVGYEARAFGVTRQMRGDDAKERCPDVNLIYVPENRGKADLTLYRQAGAEVIKVLSEFSDCLERASIDEAFIDLSETIKRYKSKYTIDDVAMKLLKSTHIIGLSSPNDATLEEDAIRVSEAYGRLMRKLLTESNLNLAIGGIIANEMRDAVLEKTQFTCSAGVAQNKMLAKLIAGLHKPKQQSLLFQEDLNELYRTVKMKKVRHLGGKLGEALQLSFNVDLMSDLANLSIAVLRQHFGEKTGDWLYWLGQGVDHEPVRPRQLPKSVGCCKNFRGREMLAKAADVSYWLNQLASEVCERLEQEIELNNRVPTHLCVNLTNTGATSVSRSCGVSKIDVDQITTDVLRIIKAFNKSNDPSRWDPPIILLGLSASKFVEYTSYSTKSIKSFFSESSRQSLLPQTSQNGDNTSSIPSKSKQTKSPVAESKSKAPDGLKRFFDTVPKHKNCIDVIPSPTQRDPSQCSSRSEIHPQRQIETLYNKNMIASECKNRENTSFDEITPVFDETNPVHDTITADDFAICKKCGKRILAWELPEHNDFHFAQELQQDMNKSVENGVKSRTSPPKKKVKRTSNIRSFFKSE